MKLDPKNHHDYNILGGLRGPDDNEPLYAHEVKAVTTGVLRHFVGCDRDTPAYVCEPYYIMSNFWPQKTTEAKIAVRRFIKEHPHYREHIHYAYASLLTKLKNQKRNTQLLKDVMTYVSWMETELEMVIR